MKHTSRLPSGAEGLDRILCGGLLNPSSYLLAGGPGTGKTVLSSQTAFRLSREDMGSLFVSVLTEPYSHLIRNLSGLSFFDERAINKQITFVSAFSILESQGLPGLEEMLRLSLPGSGAKLVVLDNIGMLSGYASSLLDYRAFLQKIIALTTMSGATLVASTDRPFSSEATEFGSFDGILALRLRRFGMRAVRTVEMTKSRGSFSLGGEHVFEISEDGVVAYPRPESGWMGVPQDRTWEERLSWGIDGLDAYTDGGVTRGTVSGLVGPSGSGKTTFCLAFAAAGVREGEKVVFVSHDESPSRLRDTARRLNLDLAAGNGDLKIVWIPPRDDFHERLIDRIMPDLGEGERVRLIIDGMDFARRVSAYRERFSLLWSVLADHLRGRGITTLFTTQEAPGVGRQGGADIPWSSVENILELQYEGAVAGGKSLLRIIKTRGHEHASAPGRLEISKSGIRMKPLPDGS